MYQDKPIFLPKAEYIPHELDQPLVETKPPPTPTPAEESERAPELEVASEPSASPPSPPPPPSTDTSFSELVEGLVDSNMDTSKSIYAEAEARKDMTRAPMRAESYSPPEPEEVPDWEPTERKEVDSVEEYKKLISKYRTDLEKYGEKPPGIPEEEVTTGPGITSPPAPAEEMPETTVPPTPTTSDKIDEYRRLIAKYRRPRATAPPATRATIPQQEAQVQFPSSMARRQFEPSETTQATPRKGLRAGQNCPVCGGALVRLLDGNFHCQNCGYRGR
jgi:hypothetical protein